jgi:cellulose synthase/poly-beta-1,6-N-acetylglucosamine synthase-like glycosyltransferase
MEPLSLIANVLGCLYLALISIGALARRNSPKAPPAANYLIVVVTVGTERVLPALRETVAQLRRLGLKFVILSSTPLELPNVLLIPREEDGSKYRVIKWFVVNYVRRDAWYIFLDDDSYPLDAEFLKDITYYGARGCVAGNGILVPRPGRSRLAYALDWARYFNDLTLYRFALEMLRKPIFGMHGELLIVRGDVLHEIWPAMGESITEDFRFAMELVRRGYKTFQSRTRVSVKSPNTLRDFMVQRMRWAGAFYDALKYRNPVPAVVLIISVAMLVMGPAVTIHGPSALLAVSAVYLAVYAYGSLKARRPLLDVLMLSPIEALALLAGIIFRQRRFYVIDKT